MNKIITIVLCVLLFSITKAQNSDELISPNWTLTDINGVEHTLYDYLDEGMSVILNFSSVALNEVDGQAWIYLTDGNLNRLYKDYGPGYFGTGEVMVLILEVDPLTTLADITGTGNNTFGDWTSVTDIPIIQNDTITNIYPLFSGTTKYPTNYVICPNRTMTKVGWTNETGLYDLVKACPENNYNTNVALTQIIEPFGVSSYGENGMIPKIRIENKGKDSLVSLKIITKIDAEIYATKQWNGKLKTYYSETIELDQIQGLADGDHSIEIVIDEPNGKTDEDEIDNSLNASFSSQAALQDFRLTITTDLYPDELSWAIFKDGEQILTSTEYKQAKHTSTENIALSKEEPYTFEIYDAYADGIYAGVMGKVTLTDYNGVEIFSFEGDEYTDKKVIEFFAVNIKESNEILNSVKVYPNPIADFVNINCNGNIEFSLVDATGKILEKDQSILNYGTLDLSNYSKGIYFLKTKSKGVERVLKVIKK